MERIRILHNRYELPYDVYFQTLIRQKAFIKKRRAEWFLKHLTF